MRSRKSRGEVEVNISLKLSTIQGEMKVEVVSGVPRTVLGEGPHWSVAEGVLYFVDIKKGRVLRYDPRNDGSCHYVDVYGHDPVSFVVPVLGSETKEFMIGRGRDFCRLHWDHLGQEAEQGGLKQDHWVVVMANVDHDRYLNRFNDGKCDPKGRLWAGTMGPEPSPGDVKRHQGSLYYCRQNPDDNKSAILDAKFGEIDISNGLEWSLDGKIMYYIDSLTAKVEAFDFEAEKGDLSNRRTVFDLRQNGIEGFPDGMTIDTRGHLWVAVFNGSRVLEINPESGKCLSEVRFDGMADCITSCAFGGPDLKDLYVTSYAQENGLGGQLFVVRDTGAQGLPARSFDAVAK